MSSIYAMYSTPEQAQRAVDGLRAAGVRDKEIAIVSSEPLEEYEFGRIDAKSKMTSIAVCGAVIGMSTGYFLTKLTQEVWPINTGGMPIVTGWSNLIIIFELTMLGSVFATVGALLVTARIPGRMPKMYDTAVSDGKILIGVANPSKPDAVEKALRSVNGGVLKTIA